MARRVRVGEHLLAVEGLALLRDVFAGDDTSVHDRVGAMRTTLAALDEAEDAATGIDVTAEGTSDDGPIEQFAVDVREATTVAGYARWAASYDGPQDPLVELEEPIVRSLLDGLPPGSALDACCGTGRHSAILASLGHRVTAVDASAEMLQQAQAKVPDAEVVHADLASFADDATRRHRPGFDVVVCGLGLTHFATLAEPVAALAVVARPGARVVISDIHPFAVLLGAHAIFHDEDEGDSALIRNHVHLPGEYLDAFAAAGLRVRRCIERTLRDGEGPMAQLVGHLRPAAARQAWLGMPYVLIWDLEASGTPGSAPMLSG